MNIFYIVSMKPGTEGGLFKATYERLIRHKEHHDIYVVSHNYYESKSVYLLRKIIWFLKNKLSAEDVHNLDFLEETKEKTALGALEINNLNFRYGLKSYGKQKIKQEKSYMKDLVDYYIEKYHAVLEQTDIIHVHWGFPNSYIAFQLSQLYNIPYFITFHGSDINYIQAREMSLMIEAMENAEKCFFVSKQLLRNAEKKGYSGLNSVVTYNGVDVEQFKIPERTSSQKKVVGYIGSLRKPKGADLLPKIFKEIINQYNPKISFKIIGEGILRKQLEQEFRAIEAMVEFTGHVEFNEVPKMLEEIDVLVVPSRNEGLGMVILEANAMGIPAVGTNIGGIPEAIGYEVNLIEMDSNLVGNMASRVVSILKDEFSSGERYRERVANNFDWKFTVELENSSYLEAIEKQR